MGNNATLPARIEDNQFMVDILVASGPVIIAIGPTRNLLEWVIHEIALEDMVKTKKDIWIELRDGRKCYFMTPRQIYGAARGLRINNIIKHPRIWDVATSNEIERMYLTLASCQI